MKSKRFNSNRRDFLITSMKAGAGLTLGLYLQACSREEESAKVDQSGPGMTNAEAIKQGTFEPNAFVRITPDDRVIVIAKHLEMGQGSYTGLATLVAEELDARWGQVEIEAAPANAKLYNNLLWGPMQGTGGSSAIANSFQQMREAGAAAKQMLIAAASQQWQVPVNEITVSHGVISHTNSDRKATLGDMANASKDQPVPENVTLKDPSEFKLIGKFVPRIDNTDKTTGKAIFTQDIQLPDMLVAVVARAPRIGATVKSVDSTAAMKVRDVVKVVQIPTGVAVLAKHTWAAIKGRQELKIEWDDSQAFSKSSKDILQEYQSLADKPGLPARNEGDAAGVLAKAGKVISATMYFPYLAHAPMEPLNCVMHHTASGCEFWNGDQMQTADQMAIATVLGIPPETVNIHTLYAGGSFGRRASSHSDYQVELATIVKAGAIQQPVKLIRTREDDTHAGYYRPCYYHQIKASLDKDGLPESWEQRIVGQSIIAGTVFEAFIVKDGIDGTSVEGASNMPYAIPNLSVQLHTVQQPVSVLWWRSVGSTHTAFAVETFIDRLAREAKQDPVEYRRKLLKDHPRHLGVLNLAADKAGWGKPMEKNRARGIAVHESFNSYVAQVAEVTLNEDKSFSVDRVVIAVDCGLAVNPDNIRAQMEGGMGFGLSPALVSELTLTNGQIDQSNFHDYQVLRINQMPDVEVHIVPSAEPPTGVGEPGTPVIAPAVANALTVLTGKGFDRLPLKLSA